MSFAWPFMLLSLALIPLLVLAYALVQRRRVKYAMRFTNLDLLANVVDRSPGWRRHLPPVFALLRSPRCSLRSHGPRRRSPCRVTRRASSWRSTSPAR